MSGAPALPGSSELLTESHDSSEFDSGDAALDEWLRRRALNNQKLGASRTYVVCAANSSRIAGFFALSMGQILAGEALGSMRRNMPRAIPAVILGRLAVERQWQGRGLGQMLLADAIDRAERASREVSARLVVVHPISQAAEGFYLHHGFVRLPTEMPTLALDLLRLR